MLKLLSLKSKFTSKNVDNTTNIVKNEGDYIGKPRYYPASSQEWSNSVYSYNKNSSRLLPIADGIVAKLVRSYFYMYNKKLEIKADMPRLRTWMRRLSTRKIMVGKPVFKHTSDKVTITLYIYNREYSYYLNKLIKVLSTYNISKKVNMLKPLHMSFMNKVNSTKTLLKPILTLNNILESSMYKDYMSKLFEKEILFMHMKQLMFLNKHKLNDTYIIPLKSLIEKIYGKSVEFNIITLKNYYFDSNIYTQIIALKTKNRKNKILKVLKTSLRGVKIPSINKQLLINNNSSSIKSKQNVIINNVEINKTTASTDYTNTILNNSYNMLKTNKVVFDSIKYKHIIGIRIEASGRLTKRMTAARSLFKVKYKGTLKNIDSSYKGISSVILRGNQKSNIQYTKLNSKTRVGSFGVKGWINSN